MRRWLGMILLMVGVGIVIVNFLQWNTGHTAAQDFTEKEVKEVTEVAQTLEKDMMYTPPSIEEPTPVFTNEIQQAAGTEIAALLIPKIGQKYSIYWGTDTSTLTQGVGMFVSDLTTVPGGYGHTVLSGHRDTVFTRLDELEKGDLLHVQYDGKLFSYEVTDTWITHEDDRTVIVEKEESMLTLTTCYPFDFIGFAPDRYIVQAKLVAEQEVEE
ncbi:class D sortase [Planococcus maritimus]|uniref:class D sortase n=1 Tax=Planococcus maritimus TaxID=192421 RepID=UPI0007978008|nr:class D sortase [Planococcus maritimus]KYG58394.1 sortase [Planococcus maritimus]OED31854.1 class D sortase [Planococcus maritimus]